MIARLASTLRALAALPPDALAGADAVHLAADCADALRLTLDCPQERPAGDEREALERLYDAIEDGGALDARVPALARRALDALRLDG